MDTELIKILHDLSTKTNKIILDSTDFKRITKFEDYFELEQFLDVNSFGLQSDLINTNEKTIRLIVDNLESAISSNCGNNIDLTEYTEENHFTHSFGELYGSNASENDGFSSEQISIFKEIWLFNLVNRLKIILFNIRYILNIDEQFIHSKLNNVKKKLTKNQYLKIFKNDLGFTLFNKMFEYYKDDGTDNANFSFLFYAMENEFLVCSQIDYINFIGNEDYKISISKIDSRQSGSNKKLKLYDSIKASLQ